MYKLEFDQIESCPLNFGLNYIGPGGPQNAGSGWPRALYCGLRLLRAWMLM
jgi:hypothetical protein